MKEVLSWINANQGFIMSILTLVYVAATIVIVIYNRKSIFELQRAREEESRPYIFAYLHKDPRDMCFYFRIKNYGKTGGKIESIKITPQLKFVDDKDTGDFLNNVTLAPDQMLQFILLEKKDETAKRTYDVSIRYVQTNSKKKVYEESYSLITQYSSQMGYTDTTRSNHTNAENALKDIANYMDSIRNKM